MLQLERIDDAYAFHSYNEHSATLIKPDSNIYDHHSMTKDLVTLSKTSLIYKDSIDSKQLPSSFADFDHHCVTMLSQHDADIFLVATGTQCRFPNISTLKFIAKHKLSIDFMDLGAASRTFNVLTSEYRKVAVLLFFS